MPRLLPRGAAQLDLGGLGQRHRARRAARAGPRAASGRGVPRRGRARRAAPTTRLDARRRQAAATTSADADGSRRARAGWSSGMALALQGSLLVRHAPPAVADAFCASRLGGDRGRAFGTLPPGLDPAAIVARATPPPL